MKRFLCVFLSCCILFSMTAFATVTEDGSFSTRANEAINRWADTENIETTSEVEENLCVGLENIRKNFSEEATVTSEKAISLFASVSYYPGTSLPTYTSITGRSLYKKDTSGENFDFYHYYFGGTDAEIEECAEYLATISLYYGWSEYSCDDSTPGRLMYTFVKSGTLIGVGIAMDVNVISIGVPKSTQSTTVSVTGVSLNRSSATLEKGDTLSLSATVSPSNATNKSVTWSSSNTSVATVSSSGVVTAKSAGTATITVQTSDGSKTAKCTITVKNTVAALKGDMNGDGVVNSNDAVYLLFHTLFPSDYPLN